MKLERNEFILSTAFKDGYPNIFARMNLIDYDEYQTYSAISRPICQEPSKNDCTGVSISLKKTVKIPQQNSKRWWATPLGSTDFRRGGNFICTIQGVLRSFGKLETMQNLVQIAEYGGWITEEGKTWHHFVDHISCAYGLKCARISSIQSIVNCLEEGNMCLALLEHELFPETYGNCLTVVKGISDEKVTLISSYQNADQEIGVTDFIEHCLVLWTIGTD